MTESVINSKKNQKLGNFAFKGISLGIFLLLILLAIDQAFPMIVIAFDLELTGAQFSFFDSVMLIPSTIVGVAVLILGIMLFVLTKGGQASIVFEPISKTVYLILGTVYIIAGLAYFSLILYATTGTNPSSVGFLLGLAITCTVAFLIFGLIFFVLAFKPEKIRNLLSRTRE